MRVITFSVSDIRSCDSCYKRSTLFIEFPDKSKVCPDCIRRAELMLKEYEDLEIYSDKANTIHQR